MKGSGNMTNYEIAWQFVDQRIDDLHVDLKHECKKRGISYGNFWRTIHEHNNNIKAYNLLILMDIIQASPNEIFRKVVK